MMENARTAPGAEEEDGGMHFPPFRGEVLHAGVSSILPGRQHCWGFELHFKAGAGVRFLQTRETGKYLSESINPPQHLSSHW